MTITGLVTSTGAVTLITTLSPTIIPVALTVITGVCFNTVKFAVVELAV